MPEDAKEASGQGIRAKRSKSGAVSFDLLPKPAEPEPKRRQAFKQQPASAVPGSFG
jgi:hypothetical protein